MASFTKVQQSATSFSDKANRVNVRPNYDLTAEQNQTNLNVFDVGECILNDIVLFCEQDPWARANSLSSMDDLDEIRMALWSDPIATYSSGEVVWDGSYGKNFTNSTYNNSSFNDIVS